MNELALYMKLKGSGGGGPTPGPEPVPTDGNTHLWINIPDNTPENRMTFSVRYNQSVSEGVEIDWGDGSPKEKFTETGIALNRSHTYANPGNYEIILKVLSGTVMFLGDSGNAIYGQYGSTYGQGYTNQTRIYRAHFGDGVQSVGDYAFYYCSGLKSIALPSGISYIGTYAFYDCAGLTEITIPNTVKTIYTYAFGICRGLTTLTIPASVTDIRASFLHNCYGLSEIHFQSSTPATIYNGTLSSLASEVKFYVPYSADHSVLNTYKTASYWSTHASKMVEEPEA